MLDATIVFIIVFMIFMWISSAYEAFYQLTPGRARRIETQDKNLAEKMDFWLERQPQYQTVFRAVLFLLIALLSTLALTIVSMKFSSIMNGFEAIFIVSAAVLCAVLAAELASMYLFTKCDIILLRYTMPLITALSCTIFSPLVILTNSLRQRIEAKAENSETAEKTSAEDEIMSLVETEDESSSLEESEKKMIRGIFDLDDTAVREIMTPRIDVIAIPITTSIDEAKKLFVRSGHSRMPVYAGSIDEIRGVILAKDFLNESKTEGKTLESLCHRPLFIPESKAVGELLEEIKKTRNHFAIVIDEYGGTSGIVTFEDIIEEIVGEVQDEYDTDEDSLQPPKNMNDGSFIMPGRTPIPNVNEILELEIPQDNADTIGGYICGELGYIPETNKEITLCENIHVLILKADRRRILSLKIRRIDNDGE